jgi:hypothetical protein
MAVEDIGVLIPTKIPGYTDAADIQAALRAYHYGSYDFNVNETLKGNLLSPSMARTISDIQDSIAAVDISAAVRKVDFDARGDLIAGTADNTIGRLPLGTNGYVLKANSAESTGLVWSNSLTSLEITLDTASNLTDGRISWDPTNKKIQVGNATAPIDFASSTLTISTPTFTTNAYTAVITDKDKWLELSNGATAGTFRIPTDASVNFPIGTQLNIIQMGSGQITIAAVTPGTTAVNGTPGLKLRATYSAATIVKRAANSWVVVGDLIA